MRVRMGKFRIFASDGCGVQGYSPWGTGLAPPETTAKNNDTMANSNLREAKAAKNDEFYTQFHDIEVEINAYLEYDPDYRKQLNGSIMIDGE